MKKVVILLLCAIAVTPSKARGLTLTGRFLAALGMTAMLGMTNAIRKRFLALLGMTGLLEGKRAGSGKARTRIPNTPLLSPRAQRGVCLLIMGFLALLGMTNISAQTSKTDSLLSLIKTLNNPLAINHQPSTITRDTSLVNALNALGWQLMYSNPDTAILLSEQALEILSSKFQISSSKFQEKKSLGLGTLDLKLGAFLANTLGNLGVYNYLKSDYPKALDYYLKALKIYDVILSEAKELSEKQAAQKGIAARLGNIGIVYKEQADYPKALDYYLKALKTFEELGNKNGIAIQLGNIGIVYADQADYPKALDYYLKGLKIYEQLNNKNGIALTLGNIGNVYYEQAKASSSGSGSRQEEKTAAATAAAYYKKALDYYLKALKMDEELGNKNGIAADLGSIGSLYTKAPSLPPPLGEDLYSPSRQLAGRVGVGLGYALAEKYLLDALKLDKEIGAQNGERQVEELLTELYEKTNRHQLALEHYKKAMVLKDTIFSEENKKQLIRKEMNFEFEKKEAAAKAEQEKQAAVAAAESRKQKTIIWLFVALTAAAAAAATIIFRSLRITRKQKHIIEIQKDEVTRQKDIVEEKSGKLTAALKDIHDSIRYAKRIQEAILPPQKLVKQYLEESFILYKPKDIVAGDFYWFSPSPHNSVRTSPALPLGGEKSPSAFGGEDLGVAGGDGGGLLFACCDCTGHGVPGAFMSILGYNGLNRCVKEFGLTKPSAILDKLCELVDEAFSKSESDIKDGMDIALVKLVISNQSSVISKKENENALPITDYRSPITILEYAGAGNSLYHIRENNLIEYKADKQPIGKFSNRKPFTNHTLTLTSPSTLYIFTDGYADQFGGPKGKKFKYAQFEKLLLSIQDRTMSEQREILNKAIDEWRGEMEQIDDICIIGVRV